MGVSICLSGHVAEVHTLSVPQGESAGLRRSPHVFLEAETVHADVTEAAARLAAWAILRRAKITPERGERKTVWYFACDKQEQ